MAISIEYFESIVNLILTIDLFYSPCMGPHIFNMKSK